MPPSTDAAGSRRTWALALLLVVATLLAYLPALRAGTIWDDDWYLTENPYLDDLAGLGRLWIPGSTPQYYPAVFTTFWIEKHLWGVAPAGYHLVNVALHALNAVLVSRLAKRLALPGAWLLGALFALHPVHVESVAWISERKNVLSGLFYLLAALAYLRFEPAKGNGVVARRMGWYSAAFALFVLALLAKSVTCSLPAALILFLLWRDGRVTRRELLPLVPFFAIGLVLALHTAWLERTHVGAEGVAFDFRPAERVLIASKALLFYPQKLFLPWPLVFQYPRWELHSARLASFWPVPVLFFAATGAWIAYRRGRRGPALALAFFAATIFPALGFVDVYPMRYTFVADHFQYLASLGILALVAGAVAPVLARHRSAAVVSGAVLVAFGVLTARQCLVYRNAEALWTATLVHNPGAWMARTNLADALSARGEHEAALAELERALALAPPRAAVEQIRGNIALAYGKLGRFEDALAQYRSLQADGADVDLRLAQTLERLGRDDEAEAAFRQALAGDSAAEAMLPFGLHLLRRERPAEAVTWLAHFADAHQGSVDALMFLADARAACGDLDAAIDAAERALTAARAAGDARTAGLVEERLGQFRDDARAPGTPLAAGATAGPDGR